MSEFKLYQRKPTFIPMRPWKPGENLEDVSISKADRDAGCPMPGDMIAMNPDDPSDGWLVNSDYFEKNYFPCSLKRVLIRGSAGVCHGVEGFHTSDGRVMHYDDATESCHAVSRESWNDWRKSEGDYYRWCSTSTSSQLIRDEQRNGVFYEEDEG